MRLKRTHGPTPMRSERTRRWSLLESLYSVGIGVVSDRLRFGCGAAGEAAKHQQATKHALAAADGGMWGWMQEQRSTHCRSSMPRAAKPRFRKAFSVLVSAAASRSGRRAVSSSEIALPCAHAQRAPLEPLDPSSGDRLVGTGAAPRADRAITQRRACQPRVWGEARGPRTTQSLPLRSLKRAAA